MSPRALLCLIPIGLLGCSYVQRRHYVYEEVHPATVTPLQFDWITVPLRVFSVRDADGSHPNGTTLEQVTTWVAEANRVFAPAKIRFEFDPALFEPLLDTEINRITELWTPRWKEQVREGEAIAAGYPGSLVVFFRHGPDRAPVGNGLGGSDFRFIVMPSLQPGVFCGHRNVTLFAHELGHHLGLPHTFPQEFSSVWAAETQYKSDPLSFDGDSIPDTLPEPFFRDREFECNEQVNGVRLEEKVFPLPRTNIMSYLDSSQKTLSAEQIMIVRQGALRRTGQDIRRILAGEFLPPIEGGSLVDATVVSDGAVNAERMLDFSGTWSHDTQLFWYGGHLDSVLALQVIVEAAGEYELWAVLTRAHDYATVSASLDGAPLATAIDLYVRAVNHTAPILLGTRSLTAGRHALTFKIVGRNPHSDGLLFGFDYLLLKRVAKPSS